MYDNIPGLVVLNDNLIVETNGFVIMKINFIFQYTLNSLTRYVNLGFLSVIRFSR